MLVHANLTFVLSESSLYMAEVSKDAKQITRFDFFQFKSKIEEDILTHLNEKIELFTKNTNYITYSLSWCGLISSFYPSKTLDSHSPGNLLEFIFGKRIKENSINCEDIPGYSFTNIFEFPGFLKDYFLSKFPSIKLIHVNSALVRNSEGELKKIIISVSDSFFTVVQIGENKLKFINSYEYTNAEDLVYYVHFFIQKQLIDILDYQCIIFNSNPLRDDSIIEFLNKIQLTQGKKFKEIKVNNHVFNQLRCV